MSHLHEALGNKINTWREAAYPCKHSPAIAEILNHAFENNSERQFRYLRQELHRRPEEERDIVLVCLGIELAARAWAENYNRARPINKLHVIELRTDQKYGSFIRHEPLTASVNIEWDGDNLVVEVVDVFSPGILQRLNMEQGVFRATLEDWRAVVDRILIDTDYDGEVFNIALCDIPARKQNTVDGCYELPALPTGATAAVKAINMLGEEALFTQTG